MKYYQIKVPDTTQAYNRREFTYSGRAEIS